MHYPTIIYTVITLCIITVFYIFYKRRYLENFEGGDGQPPLKIFLHGFWSEIKDFNYNYLQEMCEIAFRRRCEFSGDPESGDIIIQSVFTDDHDILKKFKYKIFLTGENYKNENASLYDVLLAGEHTRDKYVAFPHFLLHLPPAEMENLNSASTWSPRQEIPVDDVLVIISNPGGATRNKFLTELDKHFNVTYAGPYKNNTGGRLKHSQHSPEYKKYVGRFKFIITMENSEAPHYVTEKIMQGMSSQIVPIYWGASEASQYFNKDRFIQLHDSSDASIRDVIDRMKDLVQSPNKWLEMVNRPVFTGEGGQLSYGMTKIGEGIRSVLEKSGLIV